MADRTPPPVPPAAPRSCGCGFRPEDIAAVVALIEKSRAAAVAAGRKQAAADLWKTHAAWSQTGKLPQSYLDGVADAAHLVDPEAAEEPNHAD